MNAADEKYKCSRMDLPTPLNVWVDLQKKRNMNAADENLKCSMDLPTPLDVWGDLQKKRNMNAADENYKCSMDLPGQNRIYSSIAHMMDSTLDKITIELFVQLRGHPTENYVDDDLSLCPRCLDRLEPMLLDMFEERKIMYQRIWWTCRGLNTKTCFFPLDMPENIYWTKRTIEQMKLGIFPLPNVILLPKEYHYLYPKVFENKSPAEAIRIDNSEEEGISRKKRRYMSKDEEKEVNALRTFPNLRPDSVIFNQKQHIANEVNTQTAKPLEFSSVESAINHVDAYLKTMELEKRLGNSCVKKDYQKRIRLGSAQNDFELNSAESSKGSSAPIASSSFATMNTSIVQQQTNGQDEDPELNALLKRKMKKIVKQNKELFKKGRHQIEVNQSEAKNCVVEQQRIDESFFIGQSMKFVDEYGFSIDHPLQPFSSLNELNLVYTPDHLPFIGYEFSQRHNEEMSLDDALLL